MAKKSSVTGFREFGELLKQLPIAMQRNVNRQAVTAAAAVWRDAIRYNAPKGSAPSPASAKYGSLRVNIKVYRWRRLRNKDIAGASVSTNDGFWGYFVEYGTGPYFTGPGTRSKGKAVKRPMRAQPWFRPAVDGSHKQALAALRGGFAKGITREAARLATRYRAK